MLNYEQVSADPLRLEAEGPSPNVIATAMVAIGSVGVVLSALFVAAIKDGEPAAAGLAGLAIFGVTALVGAFRLAIERAAHTFIVTQPRYVELEKANGTVVLHAGKRTFTAGQIQGVELQHVAVLREDERHIIAIVVEAGLVELQFDSVSSARHFAHVLGRQLGHPVIPERERPLISAQSGAAAACVVLGLVGITVLAFAPMFIGELPGDPVGLATAGAGIVAICLLTYFVTRVSSMPLLRGFLVHNYGVAVE